MQKAKDILSKLYTTIFTPDTHKSSPPGLYSTPNQSLEHLNTSINPSSTTQTITIDKYEYEQLNENIHNLKIYKKATELKEDEYKKLLIDYNTALSFYVEKNKSINEIDQKLQKCEVDDCAHKINILEAENEKLRKNERRLREHLENLNNDLMNCEERAEAYKIIAMEKIEELKCENERMRDLVERREIEKSMCIGVSGEGCVKSGVCDDECVLGSIGLDEE